MRHYIIKLDETLCSPVDVVHVRTPNGDVVATFHNTFYGVSGMERFVAGCLLAGDSVKGHKYVQVLKDRLNVKRDRGELLRSQQMETRVKLYETRDDLRRLQEDYRLLLKENKRLRKGLSPTR